ncbi:MAG: arginine synthesis PII-interacting regulator PirA [Microcystaceae cyanobacterium]
MERNQRQRFQTVRENHRANILKSLEHRLEVARAKGDENLTRQLEREQKDYN